MAASHTSGVHLSKDPGGSSNDEEEAWRRPAVCVPPGTACERCRRAPRAYCDRAEDAATWRLAFRRREGAGRRPINDHNPPEHLRPVFAPDSLPAARESMASRAGTRIVGRGSLALRLGRFFYTLALRRRQASPMVQLRSDWHRGPSRGCRSACHPSKTPVGDANGLGARPSCTRADDGHGVRRRRRGSRPSRAMTPARSTLCVRSI